MPKNKQSILSKIPPVNDLLNHRRIQSLIQKYSRDLILSLIQQETLAYKADLLKNSASDFNREKIKQQLVVNITERVERLMQPSLKKVINATGIILHTGLGRAPLVDDARKNLAKIAEGYCSLEIDLETGERGDRTTHVESLLSQLTGAEAACVVNNNAAAVLLTLNTLSFKKEAIISRGQLIEIGGSFRMPDVMEKSGATMVEVGTTNKTHLKDYQKAISENTGLICTVHPSNYRVKGFTAEADLRDLVNLGTKNGIPIFQDLGAGVLVDLRKYNLPYEPVARESIEIGVDVVTFSGDKVLGGPQAGILIGKRKYIEQIKANPLMRALRCDKLIYSALEPTLRLYFQETKLLKRHYVLRMLMEPIDSLAQRASSLTKKISGHTKTKYQIKVEDTFVQIGSGALPLEELPSKAITIRSTTLTTERLAEYFRKYKTPVLGYIREDKIYFDLRTVFPHEDEELLAALNEILR